MQWQQQNSSNQTWSNGLSWISYTELQWKQQNMNQTWPIYHNAHHRTAMTECRIMNSQNWGPIASIDWRGTEFADRSRIWYNLVIYLNIIHRTAMTAAEYQLRLGSLIYHDDSYTELQWPHHLLEIPLLQVWLWMKSQYWYIFQNCNESMVAEKVNRSDHGPIFAWIS